MNEVYIAGIGQTPVGKDSTISGSTLASSAIAQALKDSELEKSDIDALFVANMTSGVLDNQQLLGAKIADAAGFAGIEALTIEAACASGAAAVRQAYQMIAGGVHDVVMVCGLERMTQSSGDDVTRALALAADWDAEASKGDSFLSLNAKLMGIYMDTHHISHDDFAYFAINAHKNALGNPNALFHKDITLEKYLQAKTIIAPLKLFDVSPVCNGAASIILANKDVINGLAGSNKSQVRIDGSALATTTMVLGNRDNPISLTAVENSTKQALSRAEVTLDDIEFFELHDAYTIISVLSLEAAGFAKPGEGVLFGCEEKISLQGELPISTMGGLKARGHPIGATGVYQIIEAYQQLSSRAGVNQLDNPELGLVQNVGGLASTVVSHILRRVK